MARGRGRESGSESEWEPSDEESSEEQSSSSESSVWEEPPPKKKRASPAKSPARPAAKAAGGSGRRAASPSSEGPPAKKKPGAPTGIETGNLCVELAKTGRAHCRVCGSTIALKAIRLGVEVDEKGWGIITRWQHIECSRIPKETPVDSIAGLDKLDEAQRAEVAAHVHADGAPEHLQEADPDEVLRSSVAQHTEEREAPAAVTMPLMRFQKVGLAWMCRQELSEVKGGILADEMGMGKTIQTISLIAAHRTVERLPHDRPVPKDHPALAQAAGATSGDTDGASAVCRPCSVAGGTLVVCPVIALLQWQAELAKVTDGSLSVFVYHGAQRPGLAETLAHYDVVLTTYSTLEYDHRRTQEEFKVACEYCGKRLQPDKLEVHLRWFCGPEARRSAAQAKTEKRRRDQGKGKGKGKGGGTKTAPPPAKGKKGGKGAAPSTYIDLVDGSDGGSGSSDEESDEEDQCLTCSGAKSSTANPLLLCDGPSCSQGQHLKCARLATVPEGDWLCPDCAAPAKGKGTPKGKGAPAKGPTAKATAPPKGKSPAKGRAPAKSKPAPKGKPVPRGKARSARAARFYGLDDSDFALSGEEDGSEDEWEEEDSEEEAPARSPAKGKASPKASARAATSVLHEVLWQRLVLDEAHAIKDRRCSTAQAVFAIRASLKWALSGTPLQNRVGELYSLVQFLRLDPLSYYFCAAKGCSCKSAHYRFSGGWRKCVDCGHSPLQHYSYFNKHVLNPIKKFGYVGEGRKAMVTLKGEVFDKVLLRRTKQGRAEDMALPPKLIKLRKDLLDERELDFYNAIYTQSVAQFDTYVQKGVVLNNYAHIFDLLTRLRQAVDHPYLVLHSARAEMEDASALSAANPKAAARSIVGDDVCAICHEVACDPVAAQCRHVFCRACATDLIESMGDEVASTQCPTCWRPLTINLDPAADTGPAGFATPGGAGTSAAGRKRSGILSRINLQQFQSSTKIEALMEEISLMEERDPVGKGIVFSQFVSMLDLIDWRLKRGGVRAVKLDGSMSVSARSAAIQAFMTDPEVKVILISLKAGGVALNLTVATHIFLMDPWWNPAAEMQAIDRAHRIGQHKAVQAVRFIMKNTVEERILMLQDKKRLVFEGTVGGDAAALARLSEEDMRFLFQS